MIAKIVRGIIALALIGMVGIAIWYYRPWSPYSPSRVAWFQEEENIVESFRSFDTVFPYKTIPASTAPRDFPVNLTDLNITYQWAGETKTLAQYIEDSQTTGLMATKNGVIRYEDYFLDADPTTQFTSWSVGKSFVATVIFMALKEGKIESIDDPAQKYAPQFEGSGFGESSIKDLLVMSTGVEFTEDYSDLNSDISQYFFGTFILGENSDTLLKKFQRNRPPMTDFQYISPNSHVLASVLRSVYDKPLAEIMAEKIWQPLGFEGSAYWSQNTQGEDGLALGYCCLNARLRDYARMGRFWLETQNGEGLGPKLLPETFSALVRTPASDLHVADTDSYAGRGYSYHFWLPPGHDGEFFAAGIYGQYIWIDTKRNVVITRNASDPKWTARADESYAVMRAIAKAL